MGDRTRSLPRLRCRVSSVSKVRASKPNWDKFLELVHDDVAQCRHMRPEVFGALPNAHALRDRVLGYVKTAGIRLKKGNTFGDQVVIIAGDYCSMEAETFTQVVAGDVTHRIVANLRLFAYGAA